MISIIGVVAVVGAGVMGGDVAATAAFHGYKVIVKDVDPEALAKAPHIIRQNIRKYKMISQDLQNWNISDILSRITFSDSYEGFEQASWIIENTTEDVEVKSAVFRELCEVCSSNVRFAVNTSCITITQLAGLVPQPERVIGMHFMNPVPLKGIVETIRGFHTSDETIEASEAFLRSLGKTSVLVQDSPGFVSNRLSHLFMNEAAFLVQEQVAEPEQIDTLFKQGYGHKMGPLETADLIGLDTVVRSLDVLYQNYQDPKFRCCPLLKKMVDAGLKGRKSGRGFYTYNERGI
ncbi:MULTISPECIES: 3-hydroxyacyl-CoA dehydrogenase family protein [unclassified Paenibacillus]|uniref:3-hydroxyacyl-CoA dehydrogenase family protein n=1 Tax=Paenibacillus sp. FSL H7-0350 TaxID=2975345 RepID=UPI0004B37446|nr:MULTISPECIES: 3-hydroxyacyl-CoA dehydrogenase family protein [unclassified Paenibacillus]OMF91660.1 3-hydroxybutyryl-CoA dehydrogenase [Paenibacillus sp. FSL R7-0337]